MSGGQSGIYSSTDCRICGDDTGRPDYSLCEKASCRREYEADLNFENIAYEKAAVALRDWIRLEWEGQDPIVERAIERAMKNIMKLRRIE